MAYWIQPIEYSRDFGHDRSYRAGTGAAQARTEGLPSMPLVVASDFTQHLNPLSSTLASTLVALIPLVLLLVVTIGAIVTIVMAITIWHSPAGPTLEAWLLGAATGIWSIDWIVFWGVVIYNVLHETG